MLSRGLRSALGAINRPMPTKKQARGADEEAKLLFDRDADNVLKSSLANLSKKDLFGDSSKMNVMEGQFDEEYHHLKNNLIIFLMRQWKVEK